jgi:L-aminopeptidase/D-esterase-like protein
VHHLSQALLSTIRSAVTSSVGTGVLVLATEGKYFSNNFDQSQVPLHVQADMGEVNAGERERPASRPSSPPSLHKLPHQ